MVQRKVREVTVCAPRRYGRYRYFLEVRIMGEPASTLTVILKNPSTASAESSDPTVGKVEAWARKNKFCRIRYVNLFALRSPYPEELNAHSYRVMVGRENDAWIERSLQGADVMLAAWGNPNGVDPAKYEKRIAQVSRLLEGACVRALGPPTKRGYPRHGLMWNGELPLRKWRLDL
ncbi:MAG: DUF1643 domain-containing protein [Nitrospinae bacterium]|nr:DUF1643 domain-containing protein [Nitrospinota bacterium]